MTAELAMVGSPGTPVSFDERVGNRSRPVVISEHADDARNLRIDLRVENSVTSAHHRLVVVEGIPRQRNTRAKILLRRMQRSVLRIEFVAQAVVQRQVRPDLPGILRVERGEGSRLRVLGIAKSLFVESGRAQAEGLQRSDGGGRRNGTDAVCPERPQAIGTCKHGLRTMPGNSRNSKRPAKKVCEVVSLPRTNSLKPTLKVWRPRTKLKIVRKFIAPGTRVAGKKNPAAKKSETLHIESRTARDRCC